MTRTRLLVATVWLAALIAACGPTTYPADVFPEMHYQPSARRLEPVRQPPPAGAVPMSGSTPSMSFDDATTLTNPLRPSDEGLQHAREIVRVNCATCHGSDGHGDGPVAAYFSPLPPVDFRSDRVRNRTDGQLFWLVANGVGNMPRFRSLLSQDDVWSTVLFIRQASAQ
jgi:mono/diheme cytochrome c family protein